MGKPWDRGDDLALLVCLDLNRGDRHAFWEAVLDHMSRETQKRRIMKTVEQHFKKLFALDNAKEVTDEIFENGSRGLNLAPKEQKAIDGRVHELGGSPNHATSKSKNGDKDPKKRSGQAISSSEAPTKRHKQGSRDQPLDSSNDEGSEVSPDSIKSQPPTYSATAREKCENMKSKAAEMPPGRATINSENDSVVGSNQAVDDTEGRIQTLERERDALRRQLGVYMKQVACLDLQDSAFINWEYGRAEYYLVRMGDALRGCGAGFESVRPMATDQLAMPVQLNELLCYMFNIPQNDVLRNERLAITLRDPGTAFKVKIRAICAWLVCQWVFMSHFPKEDESHSFVDIWAKMLAKTQSVDGALKFHRSVVQTFIEGNEFKQTVKRKAEKFTNEILDMLMPFLIVQREECEGFGAYTNSNSETATIRDDITEVFTESLCLKAEWVISPGRSWEVVPIPAGAEFDRNMMVVETASGFSGQTNKGAPAETGWKVRLCTIPAIYCKKLRSYGPPPGKQPEGLGDIENAFRTSHVVASPSGGEVWMRAHVVIYKPEKLEYTPGSIGAALQDA